MGPHSKVRMLLAGLAAVAALLAVVVPSSAREAAAKVKVGLAYTTYGKTGANHVFSATAAGAQRRKLGTGYVSSLSPNGAYVAATPASGGVIIYRSGGGTIHVPSQAKHESIETSWSANSKLLAVSWSKSTASKTTSGVAVISVPSGTVQKSVSFSGQIEGVSFAPTAPERVAYVKAPSQLTSTRASLEVLRAGTTTTLIKNARIANPLWTRYGIVYDAITPRGKFKAPAYQLQLLRKGKRTQITHLTIPALDTGLVPVAASSSGKRLIANFSGEDNVNAYSVNVAARTVRKVAIKGTAGQLTADGISANGKQLLVNYGAFERSSSSKGVVASIAFGGSKPKVLVRGAAMPAWPQN
jgi:hypothetical protein